MMQRVRTWVVLSLLWAAPAPAEPLTVFAAASTRTALDEAIAEFEGATGHQVSVSYAGSSTLARQILLGAPADLFLSASPDWMDVLDREGRIVPGTRRDLLTNVLVLVAHGQMDPFDPAEPPDLPERLGAGRLAMALPDAVPAGIYGKAALTSMGLWHSLSHRVAPTDNVRAALALVALGEAPFGIVYGTDAASEPRVSVVHRFADDSHPPIVYPLAAVAGRESEATLDLLRFLAGTTARAVFLRHGFGVPD